MEPYPKNIDEMMEKWEQMMARMQSMSDEDKKKDMMEKRKMCQCQGCPTHNECVAGKGRAGLLLTDGRKEHLRPDHQRLHVPELPRLGADGLLYSYYCELGNEKTQRGTMVKMK